MVDYDEDDKTSVIRKEQVDRNDKLNEKLQTTMSVVVSRNRCGGRDQKNLDLLDLLFQMTTKRRENILKSERVIDSTMEISRRSYARRLSSSTLTISLHDGFPPAFFVFRVTKHLENWLGADRLAGNYGYLHNNVILPLKYTVKINARA